jgi:hypothetical protein
MQTQRKPVKTADDTIGESPPGAESRTSAPGKESARHKKLTGKSYSTGGVRATGNNLEPSSDPQIEAYLAFLTRALIFSDDPVELRAFLFAHYAYNKFQRLGTPECRRYAWHLIQLACRLSAESRHSDTKGSSSNALLGQPGEAK